MKDRSQSEIFSERELNPRPELVAVIEDDQSEILDVMGTLKGYGGEKEGPLVLTDRTKLSSAACASIREFEGDVLLPNLKKLSQKNLEQLLLLEGTLDISGIEEMSDDILEIILFRKYETRLSEPLQQRLEVLRQARRGL